MWSIKQHGPTSRVLRLEIGRVLSGFVGGLHRSMIKERGAELLGLRPYQHSDALRQVDWMASSRLSDDDCNLVTRELAPERNIRIVVLADEGVTMCTPRRKAACAQSLVSLFALSAFESNDPVRVIGYNSGGGLVTSTWMSNEEALSAFLCAADSESKRISLRAPAKTLSACLDELDLENTLVVVITDLARLDTFPFADLRSIDAGARNIQVFAVVLDEWTGFVPSDDLLAIRHPETGKTVTMDMRPGGSMEHQVLKFYERMDVLKELGRSLCMHVVPLVLSSEQPFKAFARSWIRFEEA